MNLDEKSKEELQSSLNERLEETKEEAQQEIVLEQTKKSGISTFIMVLCVIVAIGLVLISFNSVSNFFSAAEKTGITTIGNYTTDFDGQYIGEGDYSITSVDQNIYMLNDTIPILVDEWTVTNNSSDSGYPAAYLIATQIRDGGEMELEDAETLLVKYDKNNSSDYWNDKFNARYTTIEPGESIAFSTAFVLYDVNEDVNMEWTDLSGM